MNKKNLLLAVILAALFGLAMSPGQASALGTEAGTIISNKATGSYTDANNNTYAAVQSNTVTTTVSQVGGTFLTPTTASHGGAANIPTYYPFTIVNTGNGNDSYNLSNSLSVNGGGASGWTVILYVDQNGDGILDANDLVDNAYVVVTSPISLGSDDSAFIIAQVTPAAGAVDGNIGVLSVTATSTFDPSKTQTGTYTTTISGAVINLTKATSPTEPKPGDTVTYTLNYANSGTASGFAVEIADIVPAGTTYKAGSIKLNTVSKTDLLDVDEAQVVVGANTTVKVTLGTVAAGVSGTVIFQVTVNAAVSEYTTITNMASISYLTTEGDNNTLTSSNSNNSNLTVAHKPGVDVAPATYTTNQLPGDLNVHPFTVENTGNGDDTYNFTSVGLYWTWTIYKDVDGNNAYTPGTDTLVIDTNNDNILDTDILEAGAIYKFVATTTVTGVNGQTGMHTLTATSTTDATVKDTSIKYTPIQTPVIAMTKAVSPTGNQPPGTELTYTITVTNSGARSAAGLFVSDILSDYLDYTEGSITVAGAIQSDANDADFGRYDVGSHTVYVQIPTFSAGVSLDIVFKATIQ